MAVTSTTALSGPYSADGAATVFPFDFAAVSTDDVAVVRLAADGTETAMGGYSVVLVPGGGGSVAFGTAPAAGDPIFIYSDPSFEQQITFGNQGAWSPTSMNTALDRQATRSIHLKALLSRSALAPLGESIGTLPPISDRAGLFFAFDADGNPIAIPAGGADDALRTDLAAATGSALIGYTGPGGTQRSIKAKLADHISVKDFGAKGDSDATGATGTDDTAAVAAAIAYISGLGGGGLYFPGGFYKVASYFTLPKNIRLIGAGRDASVIVATHAGGGGGSADLNVRNGSVFYSNWPSNDSTKVSIAVEHLGISCVNGANVGAGFYDNGGSFIRISDCHIVGFKYPVVFDQTEVAAVESCNLDTSIANGACIWLVSGALLKAGNIVGVTNRISVRDNQLNGGASTVDLVRDDGGYTHSFTDNNYNGGQYQLRFAGALSFSIRGGEFEGATKNPIIFNALASDGATAMGTSFGIHEGGIVSPGNTAGGFGSVQINGVSCTIAYRGVTFADSNTTYPISGTSDCHISVGAGCISNRTDGQFVSDTRGEIYLENAPLIVKPLDAVRNANFDDLNGISRAISASVLTIPSDATFAAAIGAYILIEQATATPGAGFAAGSGCTVTGPLLTSAQGQWLLAHKVAASTWVTRLFLQNPLTPASVAASGAVTSSGGGVGYATGAGGAVTQATSKATGVTLNKLSGQVTMNAAALAAAGIVSFTVTNSQVAATDTINLNLQSGNATAGTYRYWIDKVAAGSFVVAVENRSAGSLSEALVFNFAVLKAVAA
jgi:hypothetical protein